MIMISIKILKYQATFLSSERLINLPHKKHQLIKDNGALFIVIRLHKQLIEIIALLLKPLNNLLINLAQFVLSFFFKIKFLIFIVGIFGWIIWLLFIKNIELEKVGLELFYLDPVVFVYVEFCEQVLHLLGFD